MKRKSLYMAMAAAAICAGALTSCSDDYLDVQPVTDLSEESLNEASVARTAMKGLYEGMNNQYSSIGFNQDCGEAYVGTVCNDCFGNDYISGIWTLPGLQGWARMGQSNSYYAVIPWSYYYGILAQANRVINAIDVTSETAAEADAELVKYKAEALTMRAHCFNKLLTYYGQRWEDSNNGEAYCFPMRLNTIDHDCPLATMNQVFTQIYADLDEAIKLYDISKVARINKWEANKNVACGIYARTAMLKHDWAKAADMAKEARNGYTILQGSDLYGGFIADNGDNIWHMDPAFETTYYWSWGSHYNCNGGYVQNWGFGAGAMNIDLYNTMDEKDVRRAYYFMPDKLAELDRFQNPGKLDKKAFWNPAIVDAENFLNLCTTNVYDNSGRDKDGYGMLNCVANWCYNYLENYFTGSRSAIAPDDGFYNYILVKSTQKKPLKDVRLGKSTNYGECLPMPFGAQCKFWGEFPYGNMRYPWMRASEMILTEAEALYMMGEEGQAKTVFTEFQKLRVAGYTCTSSGDAFLTEIRNSRRAELWGEGHNFTDLKRWNMKHERREWKANDVNSGNVAPGEKITADQADPSWNNGWRFEIPRSEFEYNSAIDRKLLKTFGGQGSDD